ncbi:hypothetical protein [Klebsiella oxytoca]|uniref:hypothetical protein n=1 Tax=Klebsiella oxytoca TaxID=571 RepID=UPI0022354E2B|nr:hypothetical protein [Klebsiella oxytoca]EKW2360038.1 hypothetical protein [Klebsiella oxytoca]EKW2421579.1 hypothetical protein [Klebsiella oxytoca]ELX8408494.1 hypothetical protein [Klebsiella oxytoca]MCW4551943.1 hypothetical protein [Klebsiella oxytoca]MCW4565971.1 hypothetical protein [Klebsiella oxytoca]
MKQKIHEVNGLEFTHERYNFNGQWIYHWYFKPIGQSEWCPYSLPTGKTKKSDVENFLTNGKEANSHYQAWLKDASDVEGAERNLLSAQKAFERISSPEWGGRGNNPNKDVRRVQQARDTLESAKAKLEKAKILRERLNSN